MSDFAPMPGPDQEWLRRQAGTWDATITTSFYPGAPEQTWKGETRITMGCGGLWQIMDFSGDMGGRPFAGHGICGFDAQKQQYTQCWVDSMSTSLLLLSGNLNEKEKTMTMIGEMATPLGPSKTRQITKEISPNQLLFTIEIPTPDGGYFTLMKVDYRRR